MYMTLEDTSQEKALIHQENNYFSVLSSEYGEPQNLQEAQHHKDPEERKGWRTFIRKSFNDMEKRGYGEKPKEEMCL